MNSKTKYILTFLLLILFSVRAISQDSGTEKFNKGVAFFSASSYKEALQVWLDVYNTGYQSSGLDYNIGNAYFKLNNIPNAILSVSYTHLRAHETRHDLVCR